MSRKKLRLVENPRAVLRTSTFRISIGSAISGFIGALADVALSHWNDIAAHLLVPGWVIWAGGGTLMLVVATARMTRWVSDEETANGNN